ncbi:MAG: exo-alpha-sialidase, partial [Desulfobacteraceae bacterium]|nr:exo-alpha-sialidase [Desulfobacteraceae bacterium]
MPVGKSKEAQERNAKLLSDYDYGKYWTALTGFTGQDRQCIRFTRRLDAVRTRVGPRNNHKGTMTQLSGGKLVLAVATRKKTLDPVYIYESSDVGLTWQEIAQILPGEDSSREMSLTALPDDSLVLTAANAEGMSPDKIAICRSTDQGRSWEADTIEGDDYPRNIIVEADGSLLMVRALDRWLSDQGKGSPNFRLDRSRDGGKSWEF